MPHGDREEYEMAAWQLTPDTQHALNVALVWIGFGAVAGVVARLILPLRRPTAPAGTVVLGVLGSTLGLLVYSYLVDSGESNPIGPIGFVAAVAGTLLVLIGYQPFAAWRERPPATASATPPAAAPPADPAAKPQG